MTIWPTRSRSDSDASVLSTHRLSIGVSGSRGSSRPLGDDDDTAGADETACDARAHALSAMNVQPGTAKSFTINEQHLNIFPNL